MSASPATSYHHTQKAALYWMFYALVPVFLIGAVSLSHEPPVAIILSVVGMMMLVVAASFHHLTVVDEGDRLAVQFGPLPLFRRTIRYEDMHRVEIGKTTLLDGWGIHLSLRGGWVWNIWGRDCVVIHHRGILRVGTDDAEHLAQFLKTKLAGRVESV